LRGNTCGETLRGDAPAVKQSLNRWHETGPEQWVVGAWWDLSHKNLPDFPVIEI